MSISAAIKPSSTHRPRATHKSALSILASTPAMPSAVKAQMNAPASKKLALGRSSRWFSSRAMVTANRPTRNNSSAKMARSERAGSARSGAITVVDLSSQRHSNQAPPASSRNSSTLKPGTKYFSNCSRERRAGKTSDSFASNRADSPLVRASSSTSSFSSRSFSASRIWNQLMNATSAAKPRKIEAACPASEFTKEVTTNVAMKIITATTRFTRPFFWTLRSTFVKSLIVASLHRNSPNRFNDSTVHNVTS